MMASVVVHAFGRFVIMPMRHRLQGLIFAFRLAARSNAIAGAIHKTQNVKVQPPHGVMMRRVEKHCSHLDPPFYFREDILSCHVGEFLSVVLGSPYRGFSLLTRHPWNFGALRSVKSLPQSQT
jgi:hypothetical protein